MELKSAGVGKQICSFLKNKLDSRPFEVDEIDTVVHSEEFESDEAVRVILYLEKTTDDTVYEGPTDDVFEEYKRLAQATKQSDELPPVSAGTVAGHMNRLKVTSPPEEDDMGVWRQG